MPRTRRSLIAIAAVALALMVSLSGCATMFGSHAKSNANAAHTKAPPKKVAGEAGKPTVGECWTATIQSANVPSWGSRPSVDCSRPHQLYTFAVPGLEHSHQRDEYSSSGQVADDLYEDAWQTCGHHLTDAFPNYSYPSRIELSAHIPDLSEWNEGARWVRCDMGLVAVGSPYAHPAFGNLPDYGSIRETAVNDTYAFSYCTNSPISGSPIAAGAVFADCDANPRWLLYGSETIPEPAGDAYPTTAELNAAYVSTCKNPHADAAQLTYPIYPSVSDWQSGIETLQCWLGRK